MSNHDPSTLLNIDNESDCWFGVQNARKRKQIQDRLAQRARRKRLAEANKRPILASAKSKIDYILQEGALVNLTSQTRMPNSTTLPSSEPDPVPMLIPTPPSSTPKISSDTYFFPQPALSVYGALFDNGCILGLSCSCSTAYKSKPASQIIPQSLQPTEAQLSTLHFQWIDRFPFPRMRDNMIVLCPVIDEEEFLSDLFHLTSFTLKHGSVSWDAEAWKIGPEFARKWGYLFY